MATFSWPDVKPLLIDGYDLVGDGQVTMEIDIPGVKRPVYDSTGIGGDGWMHFKQSGVKEATGPLTFKAFLDDTAVTGSLVAIQTTGDAGAERVICVSATGGARLSRFLGFKGWQTGKPILVTKEAMAMLQATLAPNGAVDQWAVVLKEHAAVVIDGTTEATYWDNTAASAAGGRAFFQVSNLVLGTATNLTLSVEDSADHIAWGELATTPVIAAHPYGLAVDVAGEVLRYWAAKWDFGGVPNGATTASIFIGFASH